MDKSQFHVFRKPFIKVKRKSRHSLVKPTTTITISNPRVTALTIENMKKFSRTREMKQQLNLLVLESMKTYYKLEE